MRRLITTVYYDLRLYIFYIFLPKYFRVVEPILMILFLFEIWSSFNNVVHKKYINMSATTEQVTQYHINRF